jgi:hypothetical protein
MTKLREGQHLIASITFTGHRDTDYETSPVVCSCGWKGVSRDWMDHRKAVLGHRRQTSGGFGHGRGHDSVGGIW